VISPAGLFDLSGRTAVVTGALGNLGPVWIGALLGAGANVLALDRAGSPESEAFSALRKKYGAKLLLERADVTSRPELERAREAGRGAFGPAAVLVNNAGIDAPPVAGKGQLFEDVPADVVRRVFEVNFLGAFQALQVFGPDLAASKAGAVINIGSLYAVRSPDQRLYDHMSMDPPFLKPPAYGASKAALLNLTQFLAAHWGPRGVRVNALSPGGVLGKQDDQFKKKFTAKVPLGRMAAFEDLPGPLLFLASDASRYVTGQNLMVDGGVTAW
jgi:NAD(P)-dependent dehydrogenase (short-subunit alcohol dehydrogenase family)